MKYWYCNQMAPASVWSVQSHVCSPRVSRLGAHQRRVATLAQRDLSACVAAVRPTADLGQYRCHTKTGSATGSAHFRRPCGVCRKTLPLLTRRWHLSRSIAAAEIHAQEASSASPVAAFFPAGPGAARRLLQQSDPDRRSRHSYTRRLHLSRTVAAVEIHAQEASNASRLAALYPKAVHTRLFQLLLASLMVRARTARSVEVQFCCNRDGHHQLA